jgi:tetratricopeptide (TPR) repeat protein
MSTIARRPQFSSTVAQWWQPARWFVAGACVVVMAACGGANAAAPAPDPLAAGLKAQLEGRTDDAVKDYQLLLQKDPHNKYAYYNLGLIDQLAGRADAAELKYRSALQTDPNFAPALYNLAILRTAAAPQEAVDLYRHVIALRPGDPSAHLNLGYVLLSLKQQVEGKAELDRAVALNPALAANVKATLATTGPSAAPKK